MPATRCTAPFACTKSSSGSNVGGAFAPGRTPARVRTVRHPAGSPALFRWECGPGGEIAWVEGAPRGPLIGRSLARAQEGDGDRIDQDVIRAFAVRAPFRDALLTPRRWRAGCGRVEDQRRSRIRARRRALRRLSRSCAARGAGAGRAAAEPCPTCSPIRIRCASWSMRSRRRSTRSSVSPRSSKASISGRPTAATASARRRSSARRSSCSPRSTISISPPRSTRRAGAAHERVDLGALIERAAGELRDIAAQHGVSKSMSLASRPKCPRRSSRSSPTACCSACSGRSPSSAEAGERLARVGGAQSTAARDRDQPPRGVAGRSAMRELFGVRRRKAVDGGFSLRLARGLARIAGGDLVASRDSFALVFPRA